MGAMSLRLAEQQKKTGPFARSGFFYPEFLSADRSLTHQADTSSRSDSYGDKQDIFLHPATKSRRTNAELHVGIRLQYVLDENAAGFIAGLFRPYPRLGNKKTAETG